MACLQGGVLRLWPPHSHRCSSLLGRNLCSPSISDTGTSYSELSDCGSLRQHPAMGSYSIASSVIAEGSSVQETDVCSLDNVSLTDSLIERAGIEWLEADGEMVLDVAPLTGRVVLYVSGLLEHSQQSCSSEMVKLTSWLH